MSDKSIRPTAATEHEGPVDPHELSEEAKRILDYVATYPGENIYLLSDYLGISPLAFSIVVDSPEGRRYLRSVLPKQVYTRLMARLRRMA